MYAFSLFSLFSSLFAVSVLSIPAWDGYTREAIGSIVPGATFIQAIGAGPSTSQTYLGHLATAKPGHPGNLTHVRGQEPPMFLVNHDWLWQINNQTSVFRVNVLNTTRVGHLPFQLVLGDKWAGIGTGMWRWRGTMLYYDQENGDHQGIFYSCPTPGGGVGLFMHIKSAPAPAGCQPVTLHSFMPKHGKGS